MATHHNTPVLYSGYASGYKDLREMPMSINPDYFVLEDDFIYELDTGWVVVKDSGASVAIAADTVGGELLITSAGTTDNDGGSVQGNEIFAVAANKNMFFQTRIKNNDVDQSDLCVGFTVNFATNPEAMLTAADRIVFQVDDGDASILCKTEKNGTETSTDSGIDMADDTYVKLGISVAGTGSVEFFINDRLVATHSANIPDDENLTIAAMSLSGSASGTRATTIDYLMGAETR
jgi:hypothetical protein